MKNRYRLNFEKTNKMKYVGHLDLLKIFQRAIRRAKLPIHYSAGFNPHQETIFAMPLTLGMSTYCDIIDIRLTEDIDVDYIKEGINKELPLGFEIVDVRRLSDDTKNCAKELEASDYIINSNIDILNLARAIDIIYSTEECLIEKKSKNSTKVVNIKEDILDMKLGECGLIATISTGSKKHLKPELLYEYICRVIDVEYKPCELKVTRTAMYYFDDAGKLCAL